jgi:hypothetical protein
MALKHFKLYNVSEQQTFYSHSVTWQGNIMNRYYHKDLLQKHVDEGNNLKFSTRL